MALVLADRVYETSTTVSTGTLTLNGALDSYQTFSTAIGNGNTCYYTIAVSGGTDWEVGIGTVGAGTLARTTILSSSNSNLVVNLPVGTKDVFVTYPSEKSVNLDAAGNAVAFNGQNITGLPLASLATVAITSPAVNQLLGYNGTAWVNVAPNPASAGTGVVFYNATPVITATGANNDVAILTFASIPVTTAEQVITGTAVSNTVLFSAFVTVALNRLIFDAGIYDFTIWAGVDSIASSSVTTITRQIYTATPFVVGTVTTTGTGSSRTATASSGTPFATAAIDASATNTVASYLQTPQGIYQITARTSDTVVTITTPSGYTNESAVAGTVWKKLFGITTPEITSISPNYTVFDVVTTQPSTVVTAATKMGILGFVTSNATRTISLTYNGEDRNTHVNTPLANLHNDLAGLQGGAATEYFHSTSAEYTGTGTGVFVREAGPTMTTPTLGVATATSVNKVTLTTPATGSTLTIANGKTLTASNSITLAGTDGKTLTTSNNLTLTGTDGITAAFGGGLAIAAAKILTASNTLTFNGTDASTVAFGTGGTVAYTANNLSVFASTTSAQLAGVLSDETGSSGGVVVFNNAPTITNPIHAAGTTAVPSLTLTSGTNLTTPVAGAMEYDGNRSYFTNTTATGRGYVPSVQYYTMVANNALVTVLTITPFFQTASTAIPLAANGIYDIEIVCYFTRSVAGTHLYTLTNSVAPLSMNVDVNFSPIAGNTSTPTGANLTGAIQGSLSAAQAFVATGALAITTVHVHKFFIHLENNTSNSNLRLNVTSPTSGFTPLRGSYWRSTRVGNAGTYAA